MIDRQQLLSGLLFTALMIIVTVLLLHLTSPVATLAGLFFFALVLSQTKCKPEPPGRCVGLD